MTSAPIVAMVLAKENAIQQWRELIGPTNSTSAKETQPGRLIYEIYIKEYFECFVLLFQLVFELCMELMNREMPCTVVTVRLVLNEKFDSSFQIVNFFERFHRNLFSKN